jgi:outer membrane protein assembly factor BamB
MNIFRGGTTLLGMLMLTGFTGRAPAQTPPPEATNLWAIKLGVNEDGPAASSPAIAPDGTVYQATYEGRLLAITPQGDIRWKFNTGTETEIKSSPAIAADGTIYFGSRNRRFYAVTPAGQLKWSFPTGAWVDSSPAIATDGTIYFGSWDKNFYALDSSGAQKWKLAVGAIVVSSPAIASDGTIYFGAFDSKLYALSPDGRVKWTFATGSEITSSPAIGADGAVYFTSMDGNLYRLNSDGTERWHFHTSGYTECSPVLDENGNVYVAGGGFDEYCVSPDGRGHGITGLACQVEAAAAAVTGRVYCSRPWGTLQANDTQGAVFWVARTGANLSASPVVGADGMVYTTCERMLYAIQPPGGVPPPAKSAWPMFRANPRHTGQAGGTGEKIK